MLITTLRQGTRLIKIVFAFTLLILGIAMLVLPGPGTMVITVGLAVLSSEFLWARRLLDDIRVRVRRVRAAVPLLRVRT